MPRRQTAKRIRLTAGGGGESPRCWCGSQRWRYELTMFPLRHLSTCEACAVAVRCELKPTRPGPKKPKPPDDPPNYGYPPFIY